MTHSYAAAAQSGLLDDMEMAPMGFFKRPAAFPVDFGS